MKTLRAILAGLISWGILFVAFFLSGLVSWFNDPYLQEQVFLLVALIPAVFAGTRFYYRTGYTTNGFLPGLVMAIVAITMDFFITVPVFMVPIGVGYGAFFSSWFFWAMVTSIAVLAYVFRKIRTHTPSTDYQCVH